MKGQKWWNIGKLLIAGLGVIVAGSAIKSLVQFDQSSPIKSGIATFGGAVALGVLASLVAPKGTKAAIMTTVLTAGAVIGGAEAFGGTVSDWGSSIANSLRGITGPATPGGTKPASFATNQQISQPSSQMISMPTPQQQVVSQPVAQPTTIIQQAAQPDKNAWIGTALSGLFQGVGAAVGGLAGGSKGYNDAMTPGQLANALFSG